MKTNFVYALTIILAFFIISCQKEDSSGNDNSAKVLGKWTISSAVQWWTPTGGPTEKDTFSFDGEGLYRDFRSDGKIYSRLLDNVPFYDTANYRVDGNKLFVWNSSYRDTGTIKKLTSNEFSLYKKTVLTGTDDGVLEQWHNLSK